MLAVQSALGLAFNPRYLDFPFAPMTAALAPFVALMLLARPVERGPARAELAAGAVLALCALYIVWNETPSNWQALWFGGALTALAVILVRARAVRG